MSVYDQKLALERAARVKENAELEARIQKLLVEKRKHDCEEAGCDIDLKGKKIKR